MATPTTTSSSPSSSISELPCITYTPGPHGEVPVDACNSRYLATPSFSWAVVFLVIFAILTVAQIAQAIIFRKRFAWVMIMGVSWLLASFVTRTLGTRDQQNQGLAIISQLFLLLAPLWINAYVYMTAGRLIHMYIPSKRIWRIKAASIGKYFIWFDIFAFLVQGTGGSMLTPDASPEKLKRGFDIYMAGIGIQEAFIVCFTVVIAIFHKKALELERRGELRDGQEGKGRGGRKWLWLTLALYAALAMITTRIIFRLAEFSGGVDPEDNPLPFNEAYVLALDALPMSICVLVLTLMHPGLVLRGPDSEFPKLTRAQKKALKAENKAAKAERRARGENAGWWKRGGERYKEMAHRESEVELREEVGTGYSGGRGAVMA
ncbi:hypothetical protein M501DRAFT_1050376 [Patellaria atrata CBS 101060]|uniref:RTA1-domain-containing protein n=1 Tax=Patellaria atrata CBS 101060 TaxID=1346257 RepID=A0A9P4SDU2_9PEZI|nr:hypothetical protein M501DRAFT_1050376 [Patellaria atrata CBS 101060]